MATMMNIQQCNDQLMICAIPLLHATWDDPEELLVVPGALRNSESQDVSNRNFCDVQ